MRAPVPDGFPHLLAPIRLGRTRAPNRVMRLATVANLGEQNGVGDRMLAHYAAVARAFARLIHERGGEVRTSSRVTRCVRRDGVWILETATGEVRADALITCGGLHADRLAAMAGVRSDLMIVPFRGDYEELAGERTSLVNGMIYPVPNPELPFLGVHLTRTIDGRVHVGPTAVLAFKREGYRKAAFDMADALELMRSAGFWRMAWRFRRTGLQELSRSFSRGAVARAARRLVPELRADDLVPAPSGVRAQAVDGRGSLLDDFEFARSEHALHVRHVPSPAATASIRLGQLITEEAASAFSTLSPARS